MPLWLALFLLQGPGEAWNLVEARPGEVKRVYWDLFETTEVWVLLLPEGTVGEPPRGNLVLQAFFSGRAKRSPYSNAPEWPKGEPDRLILRAQPFPLTVVRELTLRLVADGEALDLGASCEWPEATAPPCRLLYPCSEGCAANGLSVEIDPTWLRRLARARVVTGSVLGFPMVLTTNDLEAVQRFAQRVHLQATPR